MLDAKNAPDQKNIFDKMVYLATTEGKSSKSVPQTKHYTFFKPTATIEGKSSKSVPKVVPTIAGVTGLSGLISLDMMKSKQSLSSKNILIPLVSVVGLIGNKIYNKLKNNSPNKQGGTRKKKTKNKLFV